MYSQLLFATNLENGKIYRLTATANVMQLGDSSKTFIAMKNNKFEVLSTLDSGDYLIRFDTIYTSTDQHHSSSNWVNWDQIYILPAKLYGVMDVGSAVRESLTGLSAGPLVVPFKYRTGDNSLSGDATIGMYAGITFEPGCIYQNWCIRLTPLISAGLSQVTVANGQDSESKSSATWATGFLITDWANLNIGVVYGQDRIGDKSWEHEGDGWWSIMIGWDL
jgi:hypothetical protein